MKEKLNIKHFRNLELKQRLKESPVNAVKRKKN